VKLSPLSAVRSPNTWPRNLPGSPDSGGGTVRNTDITVSTWVSRPRPGRAVGGTPPQSAAALPSGTSHRAMCSTPAQESTALGTERPSSTAPTSSAAARLSTIKACRPQPQDMPANPVGNPDSAEPQDTAATATLILTAAVMPPVTAPTDLPEIPGGTGEVAFARHLRGRPGPDDTVPALSRRFDLSPVYVRSELRWAGWPLRESTRAPFRNPSRRPAVVTLLAVAIGVADVISQVYSSPSAPADTAPT
jgi:hypothetical protein